MSSANLIETNITDIYHETFTDASGEAFVVVPPAESVEQLIPVLDDLDNPPTVQVLALEDILKEVMGDFIIASTTADLVADGTLSLRTTEGVGMSPLIVTETAVVSVVRANAQIAGLVTEEEGFVENAREKYTTIWEESPEFNLRTPPISRVRETLEEQFGPDVRADFDGVLASLDTARGDGDGLDEVTISLLVAAKNEELLYDISKWGEDTGVASKATFSRTKTELEEMGLIDTSKVPIDVGRPRLRLLPGDERLADADADELASVAQSLLSANAA